MNPIRNLSRILLIRKLRIHPHPIPSRPRKLNHFRRSIPPNQISLQLHRIRLPRKRPNLHTPAPASINIRLYRRSKRLHLNLRHTSAIHPRSLRRRQRQINNPPPDKRPAIRNLHHNRLIIRKIRHPHHRPHRQRQVRSGQRILVINSAIRALTPGIRRPIPTRQSNLSRHRLPKTIRHRSRGGNRDSRSRIRRTNRLRTLVRMIRRIPRRGSRRRWWRLIRSGRLSMAATRHQRERRQCRRASDPRPSHGFGASFGGGAEPDVRRAWSSIFCASLCSSAAAARSASDPFRRTSGTTSSLTYFTTFRRSASKCVTASRNPCSHGRFGPSVDMTTPLHP